MARSKNLHYVQHTVTLTQPSDNPENNWAEGVIQVDAVLSQKLGRTIRNGNQFRLVGMGASLRGYDSASDLDTGFAGTASIYSIPTTRHSVKAWQGMYELWRKQKSLAAAAVGAGVRYDDFEVGWDSGNLLGPGRTSTIRTTGMADATSEHVVLVGTSVDGVTTSLEGYYDNMSPQALPSLNPFGAITKNPKWSAKFPERVELIAPATFSSMVDTQSTPDSLGGAIATGEINWLPADNHMSHLTGTLFYFVKGIPGDTGAQAPDELKMVITLVYEGWSPLASRPKRRKSLKGKKA
jgi:hypothetical protein